MSERFRIDRHPGNLVEGFVAIVVDTDRWGDEGEVCQCATIEYADMVAAALNDTQPDLYHPPRLTPPNPHP